MQLNARALIVLLQAVVLLGLTLAGAGVAEAVDEAGESLNEALVSLEDRSSRALISAFPRALDQVFTKISGQRPVRFSPERSAELAQAASLVQRYRYRTSPSGKGTLLWVRFDDASLAASVERAGLKPWAGPRPSPLLWVALRTETNDDLVGPASEDGLDQVLLDAAWQRGLPLRLPLMDLDDRMRVKPEAVRSADAQVLAGASSRYPATGPVVGVSVERGTEAAWDASWLMLDAGEQLTWRSQGATPAEALTVGVDELTDRIVARYAVEPSAAPSDTFEIAVRGVESGGDYGWLMNYLRKLDGVSRFAMLPKQGERARFRMNLSGGEEAFRRIVSMDDVLEPDGEGARYRLKR